MRLSLRDLLTEQEAISRFDREWLLQELLQIGKGELLLRRNDVVSSGQIKKYRKWLEARRGGLPLQYIVAAANFRGLRLFVNKNVLIPRPETEVLVDIALRLGDELGRKIRVLDLGTGSGAIALAMKSERPAWCVEGSDISTPAVAVARKNARSLALPVRFRKSDLMQKFKSERFDILVANPPYVNFARDKVDRAVHRHEPHLALYPEHRLKVRGIGDRGAWVAEKIISEMASRRVRCRFSLLELSPRVAALLERRWRSHSAVERVWREKDLAGRARFLLIAWENHG